MKDTKAQLEAVIPPPEKVQKNDIGIDSQTDFIKTVQEKLETEFDHKLKTKEKEINKLTLELDRLKMSEYNLDEYQAQRVRALTSIMQEVIKKDTKVDKDEIIKLFGIDKLLESKGKYPF